MSKRRRHVVVAISVVTAVVLLVGLLAVRRPVDRFATEVAAAELGLRCRWQPRRWPLPRWIAERLPRLHGLALRLDGSRPDTARVAAFVHDAPPVDVLQLRGAGLRDAGLAHALEG